MPGKGKYTVYNTNNTVKKEHLARLFSGNGNLTSPFMGKNAEESLVEATERGNKILRARGTDGFVASGDSQWGTEGGKVDITYRGRLLPYGPPGEVEIDGPGDPMNSFVPDISSPGPGVSGENAAELGEVRVEGTDKMLENNPKLTPEQYMASRGKTFVPQIGTTRPSETSQTVSDKNVLGPENKFNTTSPTQYSE
jgi:hypothetical protein